MTTIRKWLLAVTIILLAAFGGIVLLFLVAPVVPLAIIMPLQEWFSRGKIEILNNCPTNIAEYTFSGAVSFVSHDPIASGQSKSLAFDTRGHATTELRLSITLTDGRHFECIQRFFGNLTSVEMVVEGDGIHLHTLIDGYL